MKFRVTYPLRNTWPGRPAARRARRLASVALPLALAALLGGASVPATASAAVVAIDPLDLVTPPAAGWWFAEDAPSSGNATGKLVVPPAPAPLGFGSARMTLDAGTAGRMLLGTMDYNGTRLDTLTTLGYSGYRSSPDAGNLLAISLQINADYDLTDSTASWQGRLVFEPYFTVGSGTILQNTWYTWNPLSPTAKWWMTGNAIVGNVNVGNPCPQASPCALATILATFPDAGIHASLGALMFKAGAPWPSFDGNVDAFTIGVSGSDTTYDFEPSVQPCATRHVATTGSDPGNDCDTVGSPCQTVQHAIDIACPGDTIQVAAGTYRENVVVDRGVTVAGAGSGSTIVQPAVSNANPCAGSSLCGGAASNVFLVQADDVTIHDLTVDGDNPTLTSGIVRAGADLDARNGIITNHTLGTFENLEVHHAEARNIYLRGIYASSGGAFNFHHNTVDNVQGEFASIAMFNFGGSGVMANNTISNANDAIASNWSTGTQYLDNVVTASSSGVHTDNHGGFGGVADLIQGNQVSDCATNGYGVWVFAAQIAPTVNDNTVTNCAVGLSVTNASGVPVVSVPFTNNWVDGESLAGSVGVYVTTDGFGWGNEDVAATFTGTTVANTDYGFYFEQHAGVTVTATATCGRIVDNGTGAFSNTSSPVLDSNIITGNTLGVDNTSGAALNAEDNWWGCAAGPGNPGCDTVSANVDFTPSAGAEPACVACQSDSDCDDGLACSGTETCNTLTGMCQAGLPVSCTGLSDQCNVGTCTEPAGTCVAVPEPNGTLCTADTDLCSIADTCQGGACTDGGGGDPDNDNLCSADDNCPANANPGQEDLDGDGGGNVCDPSDDDGLSLRNAQVKKGPIPGSDRWSANGEMSTGADATFLTDVDTGGVVLTLTRDDTTLIDAESFSGAECTAKNGSIKCKKASGAQVRFTKRPSVGFFRINVKVVKQTLTLPTAAQSPLHLAVTAPVAIDWTDALDSCVDQGTRLLCKELP